MQPQRTSQRPGFEPGARRYIVREETPPGWVFVHAARRTWTQAPDDGLVPCRCCMVAGPHFVRRVKPRSVGKRPTLPLLPSLRV